MSYYSFRGSKSQNKNQWAGVRRKQICFRLKKEIANRVAEQWNEQLFFFHPPMVFSFFVSPSLSI